MRVGKGFFSGRAGKDSSGKQSKTKYRLEKIQRTANKEYVWVNRDGKLVRKNPREVAYSFGQALHDFSLIPQRNASFGGHLYSLTRRTFDTAYRAPT